MFWYAPYLIGGFAFLWLCVTGGIVKYILAFLVLLLLLLMVYHSYWATKHPSLKVFPLQAAKRVVYLLWLSGIACFIAFILGG